MNEDNILDVEQSVSNDNVVSESGPTDLQTSLGNDGLQNELDNTSASSVPEEDGSGTNGSYGSDVITEIVFPEYTSENPMPVMVVEEIEERTELEVYSLSGSYPGTITDTYLDYFEGIVEKLKPNEHYVIWRSGQYAYNMCYGEEIELDGTFFSGECNLVTLYRDSDSYNNNWYVERGSDNLSLSATDIFCYSDLGMYPTVERGISSAESMGIFVAVTVVTVFMLASRIFDFIVDHIYRK